MLITDLSKIEFKTVLVPAPEFGENAEIKLRELSGAQHAELIDRLKNAEFRDSEKALTAFMLYNCLVREDGGRMLQNEDEAVNLMDSIPAGLLRRINAALAGLNEQDNPEKKG